MELLKEYPDDIWMWHICDEAVYLRSHLVNAPYKSISPKLDRTFGAYRITDLNMDNLLIYLIFLTQDIKTN